MNDYKNILEIKNEKIGNYSAEIAKWNYWDHEHLDVVHQGYTDSDILYEKDNIMFGIHKIKAPLIPFITIQTPIFLVQYDDETMYTIVQQLGVVSKTTIKIYPISENQCKIEMNYKFYLNGWRKLLKPVLKKLVPIWSERVYKEDLPLKLRRQKFLKMGFKDFKGMPPLEARQNSLLKKTTLPIPRPKNSSRDKHPLKIR